MAEEETQQEEAPDPSEPDAEDAIDANAAAEAEDTSPAPGSDSGINPELIQKLFDKGWINKDVLDKVHVAAQADKEQDEGVPDIMDQLAPAVEKQESGGNPNAVSSKGATGLMQLMPATAAEMASKMGMTDYDLKDPETSRKLGQAYLKEQLDRFGGDPKLALAAYNAGPNRVADLLAKTKGTTFEDIKDHLPKETQNYVTKINKDMASHEGDGKGLDSLSAPQMMAKNDAAENQPSFLERMEQKVSDFLVPPAQAEEPGPTPQPAPAPNQQAAAPLPDPNAVLQEQAAAQAQQSAPAGNAQETLNNLSVAAKAPDPYQQIGQAFALDQAGKMQAAQAKVIGETQKAQVYKERADQLAEIGDQYAKKRAVAEQATQADLDRYRQKVIEFGSSSIDPDRVFKNQSTFSTILMAAGVAIQAKAGNVGTAFKLVDDAIDKDIAIQKANLQLKHEDIGNEQSLMGENHRQLASIDDAANQTKAQMLARTAATLDQIGANQSSDEAKANIMSVSGQIKEQQVTLEQKFAKERGEAHAQAQLEAASTVGLSPAQAGLQNYVQSNPKFSDKMLVDAEGNPMGLSGSKDQATTFHNSSIAKNQMNEGIKKLREMYEEGGTPILGTARWTEMNSIIGNIRQNIILANDKGMRGFAHETVNNLDTQLPKELFSSSTLGALGQDLQRSSLNVFRSGPDPVPGILDRFQKLYNGWWTEKMSQQATFYKTPELQQMLAQARATSGKNSGIQQVKQ